MESLKDSYTVIPKDTNQARGLAEYAKRFLKLDNKLIDQEVYDRVTLFHTDSVLCGISALSLKTNAPTIFRNEAIQQYSLNKEEVHKSKYSKCFGSTQWTHAEKAIAANVSAVREWDSNGTVFGYNPSIPEHNAGEFGHNDFYPVIIAACQNNTKYTGKDALKAMILLDEIRGRLAEVFSLKTYKIDHVVFGAIASAVTYGAILDATVDQIESAIGLTVAHYIPWRAIRAGEQLSDSKGASAAISTEVAILSVHRAMKGFIGPLDIFRNPEALFRQFMPTNHNESPFNLVMTNQGSDFALMKMHFKLGLYEHQSAGAIQGLFKILSTQPEVVNSIDFLTIKIYQPAFGIIGDPAKKNPQTRQSADHSMIYIIATLLRKAQEKYEQIQKDCDISYLWKLLMLEPYDYHISAIQNQTTQDFMKKIFFSHGGEEYDKKYPQGIPTSLEVKTTDGNIIESDLIMFPHGHALGETRSLNDILSHKFELLGQGALQQDKLKSFITRLQKIGELENQDLETIYECDIQFKDNNFD